MAGFFFNFASNKDLFWFHRIHELYLNEIKKLTVQIVNSVKYYFDIKSFIILKQTLQDPPSTPPPLSRSLQHNIRKYVDTKKLLPMNDDIPPRFFFAFHKMFIDIFDRVLSCVCKVHCHNDVSFRTEARVQTNGNRKPSGFDKFWLHLRRTTLYGRD